MAFEDAARTARWSAFTGGLLTVTMAMTS